MKQTTLTALLLLVGLTIVSCKKDDDTKPNNTTTTTEADSFWDSQYWYIDTAYNNTEGLMHLNSMQGRMNLFKILDGDTLWLEKNGANTDRSYLRKTAGDSLWFEPQLTADAWRIMIIDSLTDNTLHYRVKNIGAAPDYGNIPSARFTYFEFYR